LPVNKKVSFLSSGPPLKVAVPEEFSAPPLRQSVLDIGMGGREAIFWPGQLDDFPGEPSFHLDLTTVAPSGETLEVWRREGGPDLWWLRWHLPGGYVMMHLREEDMLVDGVKRSTEGIEFAYADGEATLLPQRPVMRAVSSSPGYGERIIFHGDRDGPLGGGTIVLERPASRGRVTGRAQAVDPGSPSGAVEYRTERDMLISVSGRASDEALSRIAEDLADGLSAEKAY